MNSFLCVRAPHLLSAAFPCLRRATQPDILRIIKELALYEKEPDAVKCDEQMLTENIFEKGYAGVLLAKEGSKVKQGAEVIGMALVSGAARGETLESKCNERV